MRFWRSSIGPVNSWRRLRLSRGPCTYSRLLRNKLSQFHKTRGHTGAIYEVALKGQRFLRFLRAIEKWSFVALSKVLLAKKERMMREKKSRKRTETESVPWLPDRWLQSILSSSKNFKKLKNKNEKSHEEQIFFFFFCIIFGGKQKAFCTTFTLLGVIKMEVACSSIASYAPFLSSR